jgi:hypothetical protein
MRTVSLVKLGCLVLLVAACGKDAEAERSATTESAVPKETRLVVVTNSTNEPLDTIAPELVEDCVAYVPFAADTGNFFMNAIWDIAERDLAKLAVVCEEMGHTDPAGLQRISDERKAVDEFFASFTTTTIPGAGAAPDTATTVPGGLTACEPGLTLGPTGFCEPATP